MWPGVNHYFLRGCLSGVFISKRGWVTLIRVSQPNIFFLKINGSNPFPWYLGVGWKDPKRIFDLDKF